MGYPHDYGISPISQAQGFSARRSAKCSASIDLQLVNHKSWGYIVAMNIYIYEQYLC